jgi:hypothetical protein
VARAGERTVAIFCGSALRRGVRPSSGLTRVIGARGKLGARNGTSDGVSATAMDWLRVGSRCDDDGWLRGLRLRPCWWSAHQDNIRTRDGNGKFVISYELSISVLRTQKKNSPRPTNVYRNISFRASSKTTFFSRKISSFSIYKIEIT